MKQFVNNRKILVILDNAPVYSIGSDLSYSEIMFFSYIISLIQPYDQVL